MNYKLTVRILIFYYSFLLFACQPSVLKQKNPVPAAIGTIKTTGLAVVKEPVTKSVTQIEIKRFDIAARNLPVKQFYLGLGRSSNYNVIVDPGVKGSISVNLKQTTIIEALNTVRDLYGYEYQISKRNILILGNRLSTRIFSINYLDFIRSGTSNTKVNASGLNSNSSNKEESGSKSTANTAIGVQLQTTTKSGFWKELQLTIETIVGKKAGRKVIVNPSSGLVLVKAMPAQLRTVNQFLIQAQGAISRQVILEARVMEIELSKGFQTGVNWGKLATSSQGNLLASQIGGGTLLKGSNVSDITGNSGNLDPANPSNISSAITSAFGGIFTLSLRHNSFQGFIELLQTQGKVNVLSSPRVATLNNQKAVIKVGGDEFFVTGISNNNTVQGNTTVSSPSVELTPFFSGISLDVTPQISKDNEIILHVHPTVSSVTQKDKSFVVSGENFSLPLAFNTIQESDNVVKAKSGQFIIIGGLIKSGTSQHIAKVPLLGDIPFIGRLFQHKRIINTKRELMILIKPTIVGSAHNWEPSIKRFPSQY